MGQYVMYFLLHFNCSVLIRCIVFIASNKIPVHEGSISRYPAFMGNFPTISQKC